MVAQFFRSLFSADEPPQKRRKYGARIRQDITLISEVERMTKFVEHVEHKPPSWNRTSVCRWRGVKCNAEQRVVELEWRNTPSKGNLTWSFLPSSVVRADISVNELMREVISLRGPLATSDLNSPLEFLNLSCQGHYGHFDFTGLPKEMIYLWIYLNDFDGPADLTQLPPQLSELIISKNDFSGSVDLMHMPESLQLLRLEENLFNGELILTNLPSSLNALLMEANFFTGIVDLTQLPSALESLELQDNQLDGVVNLSQLPASLKYYGETSSLRLTGNKFTTVLSRRKLSPQCIESSVERMTEKQYKKAARSSKEK